MRISKKSEPVKVIRPNDWDEAAKRGKLYKAFLYANDNTGPKQDYKITSGDVGIAMFLTCVATCVVLNTGFNIKTTKLKAEFEGKMAVTRHSNDQKSGQNALRTPEKGPQPN